MAPLVLVLLFAFFFVIALSLVVWAALTLGTERRHVVTAGAATTTEPEKGKAKKSRAKKAKAEKGESRGSRRLTPRESREQFSEPAVSERQTARQGALWEDSPAEPAPELAAERPGAEARKNRATVTPRESTGDAFERFLQHEERRR